MARARNFFSEAVRLILNATLLWPWFWSASLTVHGPRFQFAKNKSRVQFSNKI